MLVKHTVPAQIKYQQKNHWGEVLNFFLSEDHKTTLTFCQVIILLYTSSQAHKVVPASHGSRFGQQDLYFPPMIEILLIYLFQNRSFGRGVPPPLNGSKALWPHGSPFEGPGPHGDLFSVFKSPFSLFLKGLRTHQK